MIRKAIVILLVAIFIGLWAVSVVMVSTANFLLSFRRRGKRKPGC